MAGCHPILVEQPGWVPAGDSLCARGLIGTDRFGIRGAADEATHALILGALAGDPPRLPDHVVTGYVPSLRA